MPQDQVITFLFVQFRKTELDVAPRDGAALRADTVGQPADRLTDADLPSIGQQAGQAQQGKADSGRPVARRPVVIQRLALQSFHV